MCVRYLCEVYCYSLIRGMEVWLASCAQMGSSVWLQCFSLDFITSLLFLLSFTYTPSPPPYLSRTPLLINHGRMTGGRCDWSEEVIALQVCWYEDCYRCVDVVLTSRLSETQGSHDLSPPAIWSRLFRNHSTPCFLGRSIAFTTAKALSWIVQVQVLFVTYTTIQGLYNQQWNVN